MNVTWLESLIIPASYGGLFTITGCLIFNMHKQAMKKFDLLIEAEKETGKQIVAHSEKLIAGEKEFARIEGHQKEQDSKIEDIGKKVVELQTLVKRDSS